MTLSPSRLASSKIHTFGRATAADDGLAGASQASSRAAVRKEKSMACATAAAVVAGAAVETDHLC